MSRFQNAQFDQHQGVLKMARIKKYHKAGHGLVSAEKVRLGCKRKVIAK